MIRASPWRRLDFNFLSDTITDEEGNEISLSPPVAEELPESGFETTLEGFIQPEEGEVEIIIDPESNRLQALVPFSPFEEKTITQ